jgi:hypothetical protein
MQPVERLGSGCIPGGRVGVMANDLYRSGPSPIRVTPWYQRPR